MITHLRTSNPGIKDKFKNLFKADTWQAHGELGRHLLSAVYLSKVKTDLRVHSGHLYYKDPDKYGAG